MFMLKPEHDAWFRTEVEQGMREADDPAVTRIPHEEIAANWRRQRAELAKRVRIETPHPPSPAPPR
jgi:hypothetical protein